MSSPILFSNPASLKPRRGRTWKRARRIEIVARLEAAFISDQEIANHLGLTVGAIQAIKHSDEYLARRLTLSTNQLSVYDNHLLDDENYRQEALSELNIMALGSVKTILTDRAHPAHAKVALDLLDRNPLTAKITKTQHSLEQKPDFNKENQRAKELLGLLGEVPVEPEPAPSHDSVGIPDLNHDYDPMAQLEEIAQEEILPI